MEADLALLIQQAMSRYHPVGTQTSRALAEVASLRRVGRHVHIEREQAQVQAEYIVLDGVLRAYVLNREGMDVSVNFYPGPAAVTPILMRSLDGTAFCNLEVLSEEATLLVFDQAGMRAQMERTADLSQFGYRVMMRDALQRLEREVVLLKSTGREKLAWFRQHFPNLENEIPHYHIASFLGMTPTSLSRIRGGG
ncbi:MAG: hypothetical protein OHK0039_06450 [Bacteroidia bacterium]